MTENNSTPETPATEQDVEVVVEPNRLQRFVNSHPRASKAVTITGATLATAGVAIVANTVRKNKHHVDNAAQHLSEAGSELSNAVSPTSETTDA